MLRTNATQQADYATGLVEEREGYVRRQLAPGVTDADAEALDRRIVAVEEEYARATGAKIPPLKETRPRGAQGGKETRG